MGADRDDVRQGIVFMITGTAVFSLQDALGKELASGYPVIQMLAVRAAVAVALVLPVVAVRSGLRSLRTAHPLQHGFRSLCTLGAFLCFYRALQDLPLADATAIFFGAPVFMALLSTIILHERVSPARWAALLVGFAGVLVVVQPSGDGIEPAALLVVLGSILYPLSVITTRSLSRHDSAQTMLAWMMVVQTVVAGAAVPFVWEHPSAGGWVQLGAMGVLTVAGHLALTLAFSRSPVTVLAPLEYLGLVFAAVFGFVLWAEVPGLPFWLGAPLIVLSSVVSTVLHEREQRAARVAAELEVAPLTAR